MNAASGFSTQPSPWRPRVATRLFKCAPWPSAPTSQSERSIATSRPRFTCWCPLWHANSRRSIVQIHGELDPYVLTRTVRRDKHWAPGEKLRTIAGVGHYAHQEAPERVNRELEDFLLTEK